MTDKSDLVSQDNNHKPHKGGFRDNLISIVTAILLALVFRSFLYEPFHIPSSSMEPTLLVGDVVFVSKYSYGYSRYSFPMGIVDIENRVWKDAPERGDVVVFRLPSQPSINYIKRLIGLPGDKIQVTKGVLFINDVAVGKSSVRSFKREDPDTKEIQHVAQYIETLPNGVSYRVLDYQENSLADNTPEFHVPEGSYFFLGDNRDNSRDSRFTEVGFVEEKYLVGPARIIFFSSTAKLFRVWEWFTGVRWERLFDSLTFDRRAFERASS